MQHSIILFYTIQLKKGRMLEEIDDRFDEVVVNDFIIYLFLYK